MYCFCINQPNSSGFINIFILYLKTTSTQSSRLALAPELEIGCLLIYWKSLPGPKIAGQVWGRANDEINIFSMDLFGQRVIRRTLHLSYSVFAYFRVAYSVFAHSVLAYTVLAYSLTFPCSPIPY